MFCAEKKSGKNIWGAGGILEDKNEEVGKWPPASPTELSSSVHRMCLQGGENPLQRFGHPNLAPVQSSKEEPVGLAFGCL